MKDKFAFIGKALDIDEHTIFKLEGWNSAIILIKNVVKGTEVNFLFFCYN